MDAITDKQLEVLRYIARTIEERGFPPTIREIGEAFGIRSTNGVADHLKALERKGYLSRQGQRSRTLVPTAPGREVLGLEPSPASSFPASSSSSSSRRRPQARGPEVSAAVASRAVAVPLLGRVAAGAPLLAEQTLDEAVHVDRTWLPASSAGQVFALRVKGDSMIGDGIFDGDLVFVRSQPTARPGEVVVAMIDGEATVKRFYPEGNRLRLQPSNPALAPIYVDAAQARETAIVGVVVGVYRRLGARA